MTKGLRGLEDALNLPHLEDVLKENAPSEASESAEPEEEASHDEMKAFEMVIEQATKLQQVDGTEGHQHAKDTEEVFKETLQHSRDLMDLGFNTDPRSMRGIFEQAVNMYRVALDAKNAKRDRQLQAMKMALETRKLDIAEHGMSNNNVSTTEGVIIEDRNELIRRLRREAAEDQKKGK